MTEDPLSTLSGDPSPSTPLTPEEWAYVSRIVAHVGSLTPLLEGRGQADYAPYVKLVLAKAQAAGLNPERIYRAAAILPPAVATRMPVWETVRP